ncbi:focadhesin isoform X2 [Nomia melanderi]|uniref:focadhesin isoform X2 n=1 Tax=Nomia melanderi TaxID=2448451 RepID=UPI001304493A|nr:focadhesin isoform X2 [Nomia melanderi]
MDEIEYKLQSTNPVLISHAISKLFDAIKKKRQNQADDKITQISEFKLLSTKRDSVDVAVSIPACQALVALVEDGLWNINEALSTFVSSLSSIKNYTAATTAIGHLLIMDLKNKKENNAIYPFTLHAPQHPFIIILNQDKYSWQTVLNQISYIMSHHDSRVRKNSVEMLRPVFLHILCNPFSNPLDCCVQPFWQLLIKSDHGMCLQTEVLLWLYIAEIHSCINTNYRILEFAEKVSREKNKEYCTALAPVLASLSLQLLKHGSDPRPNFIMLFVIIDQCDTCIGNLMLILMSEIITLCPTVYLYSVLQICTTITKKMYCTDIFLNTLVASILKWMAYPSLLCSDALDMATDLLKEIFIQRSPAHNETMVMSKIFEAFTHFEPCLQFHVEIVRCLNTWEPNDIVLWLKRMSQVPIDLKNKCKLLLAGLLIQTNSSEIAELSCNILVDVCREVKSFQSHLLSLVLHKLTKSKTSTELKYLLLVVPELATVKENIPIITYTLDTLLLGDRQLKCFAIELYLKTLKEQPGCYRFVSAAIIRLMKNDTSWHSAATCARAMKFICENHPEHGETLVPLLSQILNRSTDTYGGTASALALKSISALCKASVIDISSTWRVLAPKMEKEKRAIVLESLCELFGDVPSYPSSLPIEEYDQLISDVVSNLWKYATCNDPRVIESALKALASYRLEQISLETLPASFQSHLIVQETPMDATEKPKYAFPYVPGTCWIEMLRNINKAALSSAGNLLIAFVNEEVNSFRSGIYVWPHGEPHNFKYLPEKSVIRGIGEYLRRSDKLESSSRCVITECLRVFAHKYPKPLPNVDWSFLKNTIDLSPEAKKYTLSIACHHAKTSLSAKSFVEQCLSAYTSITDIDLNLKSDEYAVWYQNLDDLCQAVQPSTIKPFLETTLEYVVEKITFDNEHFINLFISIMSSYARTLRNEEVYDGNSTLLSGLLEKLFDKIDLTRQHLQSYVTAVLELPTKHLEIITSPRTWTEITTHKLKNAVAIRAELVIKKCSEFSLMWLNEHIEEAASVPSIQAYFLETIQRMHAETRFKKSIINWVLDFMIQIQRLLLESVQDHSRKVQFYCSVLFVSVISLSGIDCILVKQDLSVSSANIRIELFPRALAILSDRQEWKYAVPQIMEWLNYMRTSTVSDAYKLTFHHSLISLRHNPYYKDVWTKYLSIKTEL